GSAFEIENKEKLSIELERKILILTLSITLARPTDPKLSPNLRINRSLPIWSFEFVR
ncbi:23549_t:CDS:1, partial [Racocetra persica]